MLINALGIHPGECIAVVGAGGKTSLCWLLAQEIAARGERVIYTTTTHIRQPLPGAFDAVTIDPSASIPSGAWRTACIASTVDGPLDDRHMPDSLMPVQYTKLQGYSVGDVDALYHSVSNLQSPVSLLVEADGARGLWLKAPADYEPVIPACSTTVCVVANLEALGRPLDECTAHRPERIALLAGVNAGAPITAQLLAAVMTHPEGGLQGIPEQARRLAVLMQRYERAAHPDAAFIVNELVARGYARAAVISPRAERVYPLIQAAR